MKKIIKGIGIAVIVSLSALSVHQTVNAETCLNEYFTIDNGDTVVFDLSKSLVTGNKVAFPVSVISDDTILSLDFAFKYNQINLIYDSLVNLNNYMQCLAYYNNNDSTLRFSSNSSVHPYAIDSSLVYLYFELLNTQIVSTDLDTPKVYLNGSKCSFKIIPPVIAAITNNLNNEDSFRIYPNPASDYITIETPPNSNFQIFDCNGIKLTKRYKNIDIMRSELNINSFADGVYSIRIWNNSFSATKKLVVRKN